MMSWKCVDGCEDELWHIYILEEYQGFFPRYTGSSPGPDVSPAPVRFRSTRAGIWDQTMIDAPAEWADSMGRWVHGPIHHLSPRVYVCPHSTMYSQTTTYSNILAGPAVAVLARQECDAVVHPMCKAHLLSKIKPALSGHCLGRDQPCFTVRRSPQSRYLGIIT